MQLFSQCSATSTKLGAQPPSQAFFLEKRNCSGASLLSENLGAARQGLLTQGRGPKHQLYSDGSRLSENPTPHGGSKSIIWKIIFFRK